VLADLADLLHRWHQTELTLPAAPLSSARVAYLAGIPSDEVPAALKGDAALADDWEARMEKESPCRVPAHLDVVANVLATPRGLRLIDFEYVASADPNRELGQLVWEAELSHASARGLTEAYWRPVGDGSRHLLDVAAWAFVTGVTWTLWGAGDPELALWTRRSVERLRRHWTRAALDDTP
jgi:hypothetical protein